MIKCKEDLLNTYVANDHGRLIEAYLNACDKHGIVWRSGTIASSKSPECPFIECSDQGALTEGGWSPEGNPLTLADFEEENKIKDSHDIVSRSTGCKYTPLEVESVFDLKEHLESGNLFYGNPTCMEKVGHEQELMKVIVEDKHKIYLREEVQWQTQIAEEFGFTYVEKEDSFIQMGSRLTSEVMINLSRRVLHLTGELK